MSTMAFSAPSYADSSQSDMVWAVQDVTASTHYTLTYKTLDANGKVISTKTVTPLPGSLVSFKKETLAQAQSQHLDFIIPSSTAPLKKQLDTLHQDLFKKLNPNATNIVKSSSVQPLSTSKQVVGQFISNGDAVINWTVDYTVNGTSVQVTKFTTWQSSGSGYALQDDTSWDNNSYTWPNPQPRIPSSGSAGTTRITSNNVWNGSTGYDYRDDVIGDNFITTVYYGYSTLN